MKRLKLLSVFTVLSVIMAFAFQSCSSDSDDEPKHTETLNDFNLSNLDNYMGTWIVSEVQKADGTFAFTGNTDDHSWVISKDTLTRKVGVYNFKCPYTFSNGVFTCEDGVLTKYTRTFKFEHYSEYRLKVTVIYEDTTVVYLVYKQNNAD